MWFVCLFGFIPFLHVIGIIVVFSHESNDYVFSRIRFSKIISNCLSPEGWVARLLAARAVMSSTKGSSSLWRGLLFFSLRLHEVLRCFTSQDGDKIMA